MKTLQIKRLVVFANRDRWTWFGGSLAWDGHNVIGSVCVFTLELGFEYVWRDFRDAARHLYGWSLFRSAQRRTNPASVTAAGAVSTALLDAKREAYKDAAKVVWDELSWEENGQRFFSNSGCLKVYQALLDKASNAMITNSRAQNEILNPANFQ